MSPARADRASHATAVAALARNPERARAAVLRAFAGQDRAPELRVEGPLAVAFDPSPAHRLHAGEQSLCLLSGSLYGPPAALDEPLPARLLTHLERDGVRALLPLRGDFWLLWWDRGARRAVLACDQLGARAPYFATAAGVTVIGSEVRDVLAALAVTPAPDEASLAAWLLGSWPRGGRTLYSGVRRLEAGHRLSLAVDAPNATPEPQRWWTPDRRAPLDEPAGQLAERLRAALAESVRRRLAPADDLGLLLSGGLDSAVVGALAAAAGVRPTAYSVTFPQHPGVDEAALIARTASALGLRSRTHAVRRPEVIPAASAYLARWRLPPISPNLYFWAPLLERASGDGIRVLLDGEGGDELFGPSPYLLADLLRQGRLREAARRARGWPPPYAADGSGRVRARLLRYGVKGAMPPIAHVLRRRLVSSPAASPPWLAARLADAWSEECSRAHEWKRLGGPRAWAALADHVMSGPGPSVIYEQTRLRAATAELAVRHPLVDVDVVELVLAFPPELAFDPRLTRPMLRAALAGLLPDEVRMRPGKSGFDAVAGDALATSELSLVRELLSPREAAMGAYADMNLLSQALLEPDPPPPGPARSRWAARVWRLVSAELWLRRLR